MWLLCMQCIKLKQTSKWINERRRKRTRVQGECVNARNPVNWVGFRHPNAEELVKIVIRWPAQGRKARQDCGMLPNRVVSLTSAVLSAIALVKSTTEIKWLKNLQAQVLHRSRCVWLDQSGCHSSPPGWTTGSTSVTIPWMEHTHATNIRSLSGIIQARTEQTCFSVATVRRLYLEPNARKLGWGLLISLGRILLVNILCVWLKGYVSGRELVAQCVCVCVCDCGWTFCSVHHLDTDFTPLLWSLMQ